jgi:pimeloyl-ACP methyl ester carboxylesterase
VAELTHLHREGSGTPIVLLHGLNGSWRTWRPVIPLLARNHEVLAVTMAGHHGGTAIPAGPVGIEMLADDMEKQLDEAGVKRAHLVGNSLGGWLALELGQRGRGASVVAFAPAGCWTKPRDLARVGRLLKLARRSNKPWVHKLSARPGVRRALFRQAMDRADLVPAEEMTGMFEDLAACTILDGLLENLTSTGSLAKLTMPQDCPVRIAWPIKDRTIPWERYGVPYQALLPNVDLVRLTGAGHVPIYDNPELVACTVLEFTDRIEAAAA